MAGEDDYYNLLGVSRQATDDELKRAYRRLARELHPDANPGDPESEERFKKVTLAYEVLRDPERRRRYDMFGAEGAASGAGADPFDFFGGGGINDIFQAFFAGDSFGGRTSSGPAAGNDMELSLELSLEECLSGVEREISLRLPVRCSTCGGSGAAPGTTPETCANCDGQGQVRQVRQSLLGQMVTAAPCGVCSGMGTVVRRPCNDCRGEGRRTEERTHTVTVPAGVEDGNALRLGGLGAAGARQGPAGDLYVRIRVAHHERFERQGDQLFTRLKVTFSQAALGTTLDFETLDGRENVVIPPGTQTGTILTLKHRGMARLRGRGRGDLHLELVVETPTGLDEEQAGLLRRLAELRNEVLDEPDAGLLGRIRSAFS